MRRFTPLLAGCLSLASFAAQAYDGCRFSRDIDVTMDLGGVASIEVLAVSGDLRIEGVSGANAVSASGEACVERQYRDRLDEFRIVEERDGPVLRIIAYVPYRSDDEDWRVGGLNLSLEVPDTLPLSVADSSGDIQIDGIDSLVLNDTSGDINLYDIRGNVLIERDSSGDINIRRTGAVEIRVDSSGDIDVVDAASLNVGKDSSGSIDARTIAGDVRVGQDSSGSIVVSDVGGSFTVEHDSSGGIRHRQVAGDVSIPREY
ncbi:MAG: DUF4097 family beta strand repeat-containing protein [Pseudomonadota bacterium]